MLHILSFFLVIQGAYAWGPKGQEITVMIAEKYLSPKAKEEILPLLNGKPLASVASWADQARNTPDWKNTGRWHYIDVDDSGNLLLENGETPEDILSATKYAVSNFKSSTSPEQKLTWLKFIVHLVGDVHQPMHVGRPQDRGGNSIKVRYGRSMNLHYLWDSAFIEKSGLSTQAYTSKLISESRSKDALRAPFRPEDAVQEDFTMRSFLYSFKDGLIDQTYEDKAMTITNERLWLGGLRLASLLNEITQ